MCVWFFPSASTNSCARRAHSMGCRCCSGSVAPTRGTVIACTCTRPSRERSFFFSPSSPHPSLSRHHASFRSLVTHLRTRSRLSFASHLVASLAMPACLLATDACGSAASGDVACLSESICYDHRRYQQPPAPAPWQESCLLPQQPNAPSSFPFPSC